MMLLEQMRQGNGKPNSPPLSAYLPPTTLGEHIMARRLLLKLSQQELASRFGTSRSRVYDWENDIYLPDHESMPRILRFLELLPVPAADTGQLRLFRRALGLSGNERRPLASREACFGKWKADHCQSSQRF
jgi:transcriptional regulator with XRE-family HTH domain